MSHFTGHISGHLIGHLIGHRTPTVSQTGSPNRFPDILVICIGFLLIEIEKEKCFEIWFLFSYSAYIKLAVQQSYNHAFSHLWNRERDI